MLRKGKTPFIVALNKVDRCYDWQPMENAPIRDSLAQQKEHVISEFRTRTDGIKTEFMQQAGGRSTVFAGLDGRVARPPLTHQPPGLAFST